MMQKKPITAQSLRAAFAAPPPAAKRAFVHSLPRPRPGTVTIICRQLRWLRPRVWAAAALALLAAGWGAKLAGGDFLWLLGAFTPFLAVTLVTESRRSYRCGMAELEMAAAFPLHSILLARMAMLGVLHAALLGLLAAAARAVPVTLGPRPLFLPWSRVLVRLLLPYLLTAVLGLALCRRAEGNATWPCLGAALAVAAGSPALLGQMGTFTALYHILPWTLPLLLAVLVWQLRTDLKQTEELPCS